MMHKFINLALALALVSPGAPSPAPAPAAAQVHALETRDSTPHQSCGGQSCKIAALSGSSGRVYHPDSPAKDRSYAGDCCIISYNPAAAQELYKENPGLKAFCNRKRSVLKRDDLLDEEGEMDDIAERASCRPNTLIFAKGTSETGPLGNSVGPALQQGLDQRAPGKWSVRGVIWQNDNFGNLCLGLPGGAKATDLLAQVARNCPDTTIVMSGYSQGAMVTRDGIAYSKEGPRSRVKAVVTFGDPFNGAPIKNYTAPITVFCAKGDRVCDGRDIITQAHLSYVGKATTAAVNILVNRFG